MPPLPVISSDRRIHQITTDYPAKKSMCDMGGVNFGATELGSNNLGVRELGASNSGITELGGSNWAQKN